MIKVSQLLINEIENSVEKKHGMKFKMGLLKKDLVDNNGKTVMSGSYLYKIWSTREASENMLNKICNHFELGSYKQFLDRSEISKLMLKAIEGIWESYRFSRNRRLKTSIWKFTYIEKGNYIDVLKKTRENDFEGKFRINPDLLLSGKLRDGKTILFYSTFLKSNSKELDNNVEDERIILNLTYKKGIDVYFSQEVLFKVKDENKEPRLIKGEIIYSRNKETIPISPDNKDYLAYNFLNNLCSHSRIKYNEKKYYYNHSIYISCPVRAFYPDYKDEFEKTKNILLEMEEILKKDLAFENVDCEIINSDFEDIFKDSQRIFKNSLKHIKNTHFFGIFPKILNQRNSGVFLEVYYRISKKMPCIVFYDPEIKFPSTLKGFLKDNKQNNLSFIDIKIENIPRFLKSNKEILLNFNI